MKYAIISDIHGNIYALRAAIQDSKSQGADRYLLLGDYTNGFPWGNEVIETIRHLKNAIVIQGNGEGYLLDLKNSGETDFSCEQFKPVYWAYRSLSKENLDYLIQLPTSEVVTDIDTNIYLNHSMSIFYRSLQIELFHSRNFRMMMTEKPFTHEEYLTYAKASLLGCSDAKEEIEALPNGIYLFGHNHMQFHMKHGKKLFINPGSCGEPLDWDTNAAYTLLEVTQDNWNVTERRVEYDIKAAAKELDDSDFTLYSPMWSKVMRLELLTGKDYFASFVMHLIETGHVLGCTDYPVSNNTWNVAVKTWDKNTI